MLNSQQIIYIRGMKYILFSLSLFFISFTFSQNFIGPYNGSYHLDVDATNQIMIVKGVTSADEKIPDEVRKQMESITLKIKKGSLTINMMGQEREMLFSDRASKKVKGICDLVLIDGKDQEGKNTKEKYLTLIVMEDGKIQLKSEAENADMDNFVWVKIE
jgi:hypothetical protein